MADLNLDMPVTEEIEPDADALAAIDLGIAAADSGQYVSIEEARRLIPIWISKFASQNPR